MKKSIIAASAASLALAAMPIVGAFAVGDGGSIIDTIQTTVAETCNFTRQTTKHGSAGAWTTDTTDGSKEILTAATITIGSEQTLGSSKFNVVCNDHDGYQVTMSTPNLALPSTQTQNHTWAYLGGASAPASPSASYWRVGTTGDGAVLAPESGNPVVVSQKASSEDSKDFEVTYFAYAIATQDAGTYSADVTYTFAQKN